MTKINFTERSKSLKLSQIVADTEFNTRKTYNNLEELSESILTLGQTTPVGVTKNGKKFNLVYGFRRFNAIKALNEAGHEVEILADVVDSDDANQLILLNVQENVSREQLSLSEEYEAVAKLSTFMSRPEIQEALGVTKTWITQRLKLGELSEILRDAVDEGLSVRAAQAIQLLPEELHEEFASRSAGQSVSTVSDMVQSRLDEINGIDPEPTDDSGDIELLDDDEDLAPLDEELDVPDDLENTDGSNPLKSYCEEMLALVEDDDERKQDKEILLASIRWNKIPTDDAEKIVEIIGYIFTDDESDED
jgi:ParB/RepB/Spo0J family partition protein